MLQFHAWPFPIWCSDTNGTAGFLYSAKTVNVVRVFNYHHSMQVYAGQDVYIYIYIYIMLQTLYNLRPGSKQAVSFRPFYKRDPCLRSLDGSHSWAEGCGETNL